MAKVYSHGETTMLKSYIPKWMYATYTKRAFWGI